MAGQRKILLSEAIEEYFEWQEASAFAESTMASSRLVLNQMLRAVGDKQLANLTPVHMETWFLKKGGLSFPRETANPNYKRTSGPLSPSSFNQYRRKVRQFFNWAQARGMMRHDPMIHVRPKKVQDKKRERPAPDVLLRMLEAAKDGRDRCFLALAMNTGLRASEIVRIRCGDIDLDRRIIDVIITKTGEVDEQPVTADLDLELRRWLTEYGTILGRPLHRDDVLFPTRRGPIFGPMVEQEDGTMVQSRTKTRYVPDKALGEPHKIIQYALAEVGLDTAYEGVHTVRRAVARAYYNMLVETGSKDVDAMRMTQALLHHALVSTTERYLGMDLERQRRNDSLQGQPFLGRTSVDKAVRLRAVAGGE